MRIGSKVIQLLLFSCWAPFLSVRAQWSSNIVKVEDGLCIHGNGRSLERIEAAYEEMPPVQYTPPPGRWKLLPRTASCLQTGLVLRVVMLGDSIITDGRILGRYLSPEAEQTKDAAARRPLPERLIGYTEYQTNLRGGRHANCATMRACVVNADGTGRRVLAEELTDKPDTWTQFAGWSPDGRVAILGQGWESPESAAWEEEHKTFRMTDGWRLDTWFLELKSGKLLNITGVDRVSDYNSGVFFWPGRTDRLGFQALVKGISHPFAMDLDGRNKRDLSAGGEGFAYGFNASPDGKLITYHKDYRVYIAEVDGSHPKLIATGQPFNFAPQWSADGQWLLFVSGEHYNCHPYVVRRDGTGLKKVGDRAGHRGEVTIFDVFDFHGGSSDVPAWSKDSRWVYYTSKAGEAVELMRTSLDGQAEQLTYSPDGALNYHPTPSPDGRWLAFGSTRTGTRQLYLVRTPGGEVRALTNVAPGHGAMWPQWQPP